MCYRQTIWNSCLLLWLSVWGFDYTRCILCTVHTHLFFDVGIVSSELLCRWVPSLAYWCTPSGISVRNPTFCCVARLLAIGMWAHVPNENVSEILLSNRRDLWPFFDTTEWWQQNSELLLLQVSNLIKSSCNSANVNCTVIQVWLLKCMHFS